MCELVHNIHNPGSDSSTTRFAKGSACSNMWCAIQTDTGWAVSTKTCL